MVPVLRSGTPLKEATGALILLHGRGGSAEDMLSLGIELAIPKTSLLAPQALNHTWYPNSFLAPVASNEPWLSDSLAALSRVLDICLSAGVRSESVAIAGFSQGACLACEFVARNAGRYAGVVAWTGGLIGPLGSDLRHSGSLLGTPALLSSGDPDPHVPWSRVEETARQFRDMEGSVVINRYPVDRTP